MEKEQDPALAGGEFSQIDSGPLNSTIQGNESQTRLPSGSQLESVDRQPILGSDWRAWCQVAAELGWEIELDTGDGNGVLEFKWPFRLAQRLQSRFESLGPNMSLDELQVLRSAVTKFCEVIETRLIGTGLRDYSDFESFWDEFIVVWGKVKYREGEDPLVAAFRISKTIQFKLLKNPSGTTLVILASAAYVLEGLCEGGAILLPQERIAEILHCSIPRVSALLSILCEMGLLIVIEECIPHRKAKRYRFDLNRSDLFNVD